MSITKQKKLRKGTKSHTKPVIDDEPISMFGDFSERFICTCGNGLYTIDIVYVVRPGPEHQPALLSYDDIVVYYCTKCDASYTRSLSA